MDRKPKDRGIYYRTRLSIWFRCTVSIPDTFLPTYNVVAINDKNFYEIFLFYCLFVQINSVTIITE